MHLSQHIKAVEKFTFEKLNFADICDLVQQNGATGPKRVFAIHVVEVSNVNISGTSSPIYLKIEAGTYVWS